MEERNRMDRINPTCTLPDCVDAREQAARVPGLLELAERLGKSWRLMKHIALERAQGLFEAETRRVAELRVAADVAETLRQRGRALEDELVSLRQEISEANSRAFTAGVQVTELRRQVERLTAAKDTALAANLRLIQQGELLQQELEALRVDLAAPWFGTVGDRRVWEVREAHKKALKALEARTLGRIPPEPPGPERLVERPAVVMALPLPNVWNVSHSVFAP